MNDKQTPQADPEQLLKLLDVQMAASRQRRQAQESARSRAGMIGIAVIVIGAAVALGMLMMMLQEMRPEHRDGAAIPAEKTN